MVRAKAKPTLFELWKLITKTAKSSKTACCWSMILAEVIHVGLFCLMFVTLKIILLRVPQNRRNILLQCLREYDSHLPQHMVLQLQLPEIMENPDRNHWFLPQNQQFRSSSISTLATPYLQLPSLIGSSSRQKCKSFALFNSFSPGSGLWSRLLRQDNAL